MILDKLLNFSEDVAITGSTTSDAIDFVAGGDAVGQELTFETRATVTFTAGTAATLQVKLQTSADNSTWSDLVLSPAITINGTKAGATIFKVRVPQGMKRYGRVSYVVGGSGGITAGKVYAFMSKEL